MQPKCLGTRPLDCSMILGMAICSRNHKEGNRAHLLRVPWRPAPHLTAWKAGLDISSKPRTRLQKSSPLVVVTSQ